MLVVKTEVRPSSIEGLGLFAAEKISRGETVWRFDPRFDIAFPPSDIEQMAQLQKELLMRYAYLSTDTGVYIFCIDDARFMNHSSTSNNLDTVPFPGEAETRAVANRDIEAGEELTVNYKTFDQNDATSQEDYLKR